MILFLIPPLNSYSQKVPGLSTGKGFSITAQITYVSSATIQLAPFSADLLVGAIAEIESKFNVSIDDYFNHIENGT